MNRTKLKNYAPQARRDFIQAMTDRAAFYGLAANKIDPVLERGDVAVIAGREHPRAVAKKRNALEKRVRQHGHEWSKGFSQAMEALAYTWFNRLVAARFMELHGYLDHGYRVLSHPEGKPTPEILEHAEHLDLPGLDKQTVIDLKIDGSKEAQVYRLLLLAQCNALHSAMPFLFERIDDETELLFPDNLLHSDSLIRKLVSEIDEEDWHEVEIIGWLYQFYISEKKDEVIGKVVASEDIPAATQLFTPNWIVKYLVQNTLGRQWLATYPQSPLRQQMQYYIEPAEQTPEVQEQLKAITPTSLNPEEMTLLDPACGSGHILVEAYDVFKAIYQERGYRAKDIPALILQKNLFGLEIDDRAAQLASFALMMKARADDRRIFDSQANPNILAFQESKGMNAVAITTALNSPILKEALPPSGYLLEEIEEVEAGLFSKKALAERGHVSQSDIASLLDVFENAKTFGSLILVPPKLVAKLPEIDQRLRDVLKHGDLTHAPAHVIKPLLQQARLLARQYDAVVANPPYMGSLCGDLKKLAATVYPTSKSNLFAMFLVRGFQLTREHGSNAMVTMQAWMFLSSFEELRTHFLSSKTIETLAHFGPGAFSEISGEVVTVAATVFRKCRIDAYKPTFFRLVDGNEHQKQQNLLQRMYRHNDVRIADFSLIPGSPVAYWVSTAALKLFANPPITEAILPATGLQTGDNPRFIRKWYEVPFADVDGRWMKLNDGGGTRRWYGNFESVIDWGNGGKQIREHKSAVIRNERFYGCEGLTWSRISTAYFSVRYLPKGFIFDQAGDSAFPVPGVDVFEVMALLNSAIGNYLGQIINPTHNFTAGNISKFPLLLLDGQREIISDLSRSLMAIARGDWDSFETSWDFKTLPVIQHKGAVLRQSQEAADAECLERFTRMRELEEKNNNLFIEAHGLQEDLSPEVPDEQITLYRPDREEDIKRLLSYAIGCMMGRYSLDKPGLIYADSANRGFDPSQYKTCLADDDGIIPLLETDWGIRDDAANRIVEFISVAWLREHLEENLKFIADRLGPTSKEQPRDTIRRYVATGFYKHHLHIYKRRPIYWLFSSGKQRAFQCLVYLHRYHEGTLARMRTEYVIPLQGQIAARIEQLEGDKAKATSTSHRRKLQMEQDDLKKQQAELLTFEEKLKHAADQKINLDLDDGVKVNYGKFGDLLAEIKAVTGAKDEE
jgi:hypothetical protein